MSETSTTTESNLTADELAAARRAGMSAEKYEAMKGVKTFADYEALKGREREDAEKDRLKAALTEALLEVSQQAPAEEGGDI